MKVYEIQLLRAGSEGAREVDSFEIREETPAKAESSVLQFLPENVVCVRAVEVRHDQTL